MILAEYIDGVIVLHKAALEALYPNAERELREDFEEDDIDASLLLSEYTSSFMQDIGLDNFTVVE